MRKQYLHLSAYVCNQCNGPSVTGSLAVRENEISKETEIWMLGEVCLSCGHTQHHAGSADFARHFPPTEWQLEVDPNPMVALQVEPVELEPASRG
jgi:hypothetical protein